MWFFLKKVCMNKKYIVKENTEFNEIINTVKQCRKLEGKNYTNGNLNREI